MHVIYIKIPTQQEMVTSDMIPEFAETASEPEGAEGGEMVRKGAGSEDRIKL